MTRFVALSDVHNQLSKVDVPKCDILLISGDLTMMGTEKEIQKFNTDVRRLKNNGTAGKIVCCAGNHDFLFATDNKKARKLIPDVDHYLQDEEVSVDGFRIYASPYAPEFGDWAFYHPRNSDALRSVWHKVPKGLDILMTHGPAFGMLDDTVRGERVGCEDLLDVVLDRKPKIHIAGHIHYAYGEKHFNGTTFINASTCNEQYHPVNPPIVFEL